MDSTSSESGEPAASAPSFAQKTVARLASEDHAIFPFDELVAREYRFLDGQPPPEPGASTTMPATSTRTHCADPGIADEPWVRHTDRDLFGLALSGGGIRSATFNLGVLQSLQRKNLLGHLDYLSTVSGGGYVGGFWTAWRHHHPDDAVFPDTKADPPPPGQLPPAPKDHREPAPLRHLREFSRFLMPRVGFFHSETWDGIVTILGGMMPAFAAALAALVMAHYVWLVADHWLVRVAPAGGLNVGLIILAVATALLLLGCEINWRRARKRGATDPWFRPYAVVIVVATAVAAGLWQLWTGSRFYTVALDCWPISARGLLLAANRPDAREFSLVPFGLSLVWIGTALVLLVLRALRARFEQDEDSRSTYVTKLERAASRLLAAALVWAVFAGTWSLTLWLSADGSTDLAAGTGSALAATCGGLFVWLRNWLAKPTQESPGTTLLPRVLAILKPMAPQLLANATVLLLFVLVALLSFDFYRDPFRAQLLPLGALLVIAATLVFFDPHRVGMHDFYRSRIARCYLGAARAEEHPLYRRFTSEQPDDDIRLRDLAARPHRPLHLVCTTANNLAGDVLGNLYRGGRSAVVSPLGLTIGHYTGAQPKLRLSAALTASAAAFNSQMGGLSVSLGPAVAFLMCAFNLRLGLWRPHPLNPRLRNRAPGFRFFYEMLGITDCEPLSEELRAALVQAKYQFRNLPVVHQVDLTGKAVHLSDGGHFENLALYELVRRHCRYVIVSDCGADPTVAFDDLANAQRRVREDFGVEVEIDVTPLRPDASGRSKQHAVVGTIHYDGYEGSDKGTLIYFKPTLTGDEPPDVLQYQARNTSFPHESTGDQFYDEPQWEAYRRLGQHAGNVVLRFTENYPRGRHETSAHFVENVFLDANRTWHAAPERQSEAFLALTERCAALENDIRQNAPEALKAEFFPEAAAALGAKPGAAAAPSEQENLQTLYYLMLVAQVMEDVWLGAELDRYWSHPLNEGWMNYFHRWAATPSFRRWWPVIRPIFSNGFRDFVRDRFALTYAKNDGPGARLDLLPFTQRPEGLAWDHWRRQGRDIPTGVEILEYHLTLEGTPAGPSWGGFPVALLFYRIAGNEAWWNAEDFFVPRSLNGSGISARFLRVVIAELAGRQRRRLTVMFTPKRRNDPGSRLQHLQEISFYKSRGFVSHGPTDAAGNYRLVRLPDSA
jgi:hypothetical protein